MVEPGAFGERRQRRLADMDQSIVELENDRRGRRAGFRAAESIENLRRAMKSAPRLAREVVTVCRS
jgi:hypothetical protein